jgi:hypothetical protein
VRKIYYLFIAFIISISAFSQDGVIGFAIICDSSSLAKDGNEINKYALTLKEEGLNTIIIEDKWHSADSIRKVLRSLYTHNKSFEGAVFIGDIPIPMIRDAQHLSSAFKMDQERYSWDRSSIPSDRFYEDFHLKFNFLKADEKGLYFYYSLAPDSPQYLSPDIYSGRIRIPDDKDGAKLRAYLVKVTDAHKNREKVNNMLFFAGHGYNSESMTARMDEKAALLQQFPQLNRQQNGLEYIDFSFDDHVKNVLLPALAEKETEIALLHHHGSFDAELVDGESPANGVQNQIESIKLYLRTKLRDSRKPDEVKAGFINSLGVPESWFNGIDDKSQTLKDSVFFADMDITSSDVARYNIKTRFIVFDACFNGSFYKDDYISAAYVFGPGRTIAAQANTVNSLQDKFPDEMIGLLSYGIRVGEWNKMVCYLESHIIGDPTFRFTSSDPLLDAGKFVSESNSDKGLIRFLDYPHPDVQCWAMYKLALKKYKGISDILTRKYYDSPYAVVRMEAFKQLSHLRDDNFIRVVASGLDDSYELVRRFAATYCQESGDPRLIPALIKAVTDPNISKRVAYQAGQALGYFDKELLITELNKQFRNADTSNYMGTIYRQTINNIIRQSNSVGNTLAVITAKETSDRDRKFEIKSLRNSTYHTIVPELCDYIKNAPGEKTEVLLLEALGWFNYGYRRNEIIETCRQVIASEKFSDNSKQEAQRTISRLE